MFLFLKGHSSYLPDFIHASTAGERMHHSLGVLQSLRSTTPCWLLLTLFPCSHQLKAIYSFAHVRLLPSLHFCPLLHKGPVHSNKGRRKILSHSQRESAFFKKCCPLTQKHHQWSLFPRFPVATSSRPFERKLYISTVWDHLVCFYPALAPRSSGK